MPLIHFDHVSLAFGDRPLLKQAEFTLEPGERVCLIGRNGAGKSSLQKLVTGEIMPDDGEIRYQQNLKISRLEQTMPDALDLTVNDVIHTGLASLKSLITQYETLTERPDTPENLVALQQLQAEIETLGGWQLQQQVDTLVSQLALPQTKKMNELSGGWRRRVMLGKSLVSQPDVLLLDEPTNHLDIQTIEWLENHLKQCDACILFITHDRMFLRRLATRILELDRGILTSWPGNYSNYLRRKQELETAQAHQDAVFDKKLAQEEAWIRQGVKARRTRNEGRVRNLAAMRVEAEERIPKSHTARIPQQTAESSGKIVINAKHIHYAFKPNNQADSKTLEPMPLIEDFSFKIQRGDRVGIIGNNGVGKSTLLRILLGELEPDKGTVKLGSNLHIRYFDQLHQDLELDKSIADNISDGKDYIKINGKDRHVIGYLRDFLFSHERAKKPVKALSGGEQNRVLLAKLFSQPSNLLILDEPTNDLDVEMLDALESHLISYTGTLIIVSHDRKFLDNVVDNILVFESGQKISHYHGGYSDWIKRNKVLAVAEKESPLTTHSTKKELTEKPTRKTSPKKLAYNEQRELAALPSKIDQLEIAIAELESLISNSDFYQQDHSFVQETLEQFAEKQTELNYFMERWLELSEGSGLKPG